MAKKLYYKIGEACKLLEIQPYVLRYWETEFPFLKPSKSKSGQRVYETPQLDLIRRVKELLYDEEYTIAGAKKKLEAELEAGEISPQAPKQESAKRPAAGKKTKAAAKDTAAEATAQQLDSGVPKRMEKLLAGIEEGLAQSREILKLIESGSLPLASGSAAKKKAG